MLKPRCLRAGDTVAAITPSWGGPGQFPERYAVGKRQFEETFGVHVVEMPHTLADPVWLAQHPEARASDLMDAFRDPAIAGIVATIGGEDSIRLLRYLDLDVIRHHPKVFVGYSDITVSHFACFAAGLVSFYGPTLMTGFAENGGMHHYAAESFRRAVFQTDPIGVIEPNRDGWTVEMLDWGNSALQEQRRTLQPSAGWAWLQGTGVTTGPLLGGCIEVVDWLRGTTVWPPLEHWSGAILFLETSEEQPPPEYVTRTIRVFNALGILERINGVLLGRPGGDKCDPDAFGAYDEALLHAIRDEAGLTELPIVTRVDFGHTDPIMTLPYGVAMQIDCRNQTLTITESAVRA